MCAPHRLDRKTRNSAQSPSDIFSMIASFRRFFSTISFLCLATVPSFPRPRENSGRKVGALCEKGVCFFATLGYFLKKGYSCSVGSHSRRNKCCGILFFVVRSRHVYIEWLRKRSILRYSQQLKYTMPFQVALESLQATHLGYMSVRITTDRGLFAYPC
jgi:hypothetical protein